MMGPKEDVDSVGAVGKEAEAIDPRPCDLLGSLLHPIGVGEVPLREVVVDRREDLAGDERGEEGDQEPADALETLPFGIGGGAPSSRQIPVRGPPSVHWAGDGGWRTRVGRVTLCETKLAVHLGGIEVLELDDAELG